MECRNRPGWEWIAERPEVRKRSFDSRCFILEQRCEGPQPPAHNRAEDGCLSLLMPSLVPESRLASCHLEPTVKKRQQEDEVPYREVQRLAQLQAVQDAEEGWSPSVSEMHLAGSRLPDPFPPAFLPFLHLLVALM